MHKFPRMRLPVLAFALSAATIAGCAEDWQSDVYPATGRITINGSPPAGALVQLIPAENSKPDARNSRPWGLVGADGTFVLSTYGGEPGAPVGDYMVTFTWPPDASKPSIEDRLKGKYASPSQSQWRVAIKAESNVLPFIEVTNANVDMKMGTKVTSTASPPPGPMLPPITPAKTRKGRR